MCSRRLNRHKTSTTAVAASRALLPDTTKPPESRGFSSVDLIELYSNNSDGSQLTVDQQKSWATQARNSVDRAPVFEPHAHALRRRLGAKICDEILDRYAAGETAKALAAEYNVSRNAILNLARRSNVVVRRQSPTDAQQASFAREYEAGATIAGLVERHGYSYGAIRTALRNAEVQMRPRGGSVKRS